MSGVGRVLAALANDTRRQIVVRLASGPPTTATELAADLPMSRQAVTRHLRVLEGADLVRAERRGRETVYELEPATLGEASTWLEEVGETWDRRLARLKKQAEAAERAGPERG